VQILIATGNPGKVREFREMLGRDRFAWSDLSQHREATPVEETGATFRANACLKASGYAKQLGTWALADDSGLEVDALGGNPGVTSARWAELHNNGSGDADNNALLLEQMRNVSDDRRSARFVCVLALSDPQGRVVLTASDVMEGRLLRAPRGENGFGYDPLFEVQSLDKTSAELAPVDKHRISHRGKALMRLRALMDRVFTPSLA
jgi:non-canonical purine NTP pyrophosphatase (RdgB/HAM1 family)